MHRQQRSHGPTGSGLALALVLTLAAWAGPAAAHTGTAEHGTIGFQDEPGDTPQTSTTQGQDPVELSCEFRVQGSNMSHANGTILASHELDGRDAHTHEIADWEAQPNASGGWDFEIGPVTLHEDGDWLIQATAGTGNHSTQAHDVTYETCEDHQEPLPGNDPHDCEGPPGVDAYIDGSAIVVTWDHHQDPAHTANYTVYRSEAGERNFTAIATVDANETLYRDHGAEPGTEYVYTVTGTDADTGREADPCDHVRITAQEDTAPACPQNPSAEAREDGGIALSWNRVEGADTYKVYRSTNETEFYQIATVQNTTHLDPDTEADQTYEYRIAAANEDGESERCPRIEATAIPSFPTSFLVAASAIGGVAAFLAVSRTR